MSTVQQIHTTPLNSIQHQGLPDEVPNQSYIRRAETCKKEITKIALQSPCLIVANKSQSNDD